MSVRNAGRHAFRAADRFTRRILAASINLTPTDRRCTCAPVKIISESANEWRRNMLETLWEPPNVSLRNFLAPRDSDSRPIYTFVLFSLGERRGGEGEEPVGVFARP